VGRSLSRTSLTLIVSTPLAVRASVLRVPQDRTGLPSPYALVGSVHPWPHRIMSEAPSAAAVSIPPKLEVSGSLPKPTAQRHGHLLLQRSPGVTAWCLRVLARAPNRSLRGPLPLAGITKNKEAEVSQAFWNVLACRMA